MHASLERLWLKLLPLFLANIFHQHLPRKVDQANTNKVALQHTLNLLDPFTVKPTLYVCGYREVEA